MGRHDHRDRPSRIPPRRHPVRTAQAAPHGGHRRPYRRAGNRRVPYPRPGALDVLDVGDPQPVGGGDAEFGLGAYRDAFSKVRMGLLFWNSVLVTGLVAIGQMITAAMAGYVFARMEFRGKHLLFGIILATMMVPLQVTIVPVFMLIRGMGLSDTLLALILPALPTAFGTFLMRQYFMGLPPELGEAAEVDGAGPFRTFVSIYAPLALPGLAIVGILAFNYHWNEFFRPLILTISEENFTLPLGLVTLQGNLGTGSVATVLAGVVLSMIPALLVFVLGQRPLREGLTAGTSK
jgi:multiple sugar transport system permease protein